MKKIIFAAFALFASFSVVNAQDVAAPADEAAAVQEMNDEKVQIKPEELPEAVRTSLSSADYSGWAISEAYRHNDEEIYEVELKNGAETKTLKFDKEGNKIEE